MIIPYITFHGECADALKFYSEAFECAKPDAHLYGDYVPADLKNPPVDLSIWIMHAEMDICGNRFWFADETEPVTPGNNVKLVLAVATTAEAKRFYNALSLAGEVVLPPTETYYSTFHASLIDRFGVCWNIVAEEEPVSGEK